MFHKALYFSDWPKEMGPYLPIFKSVGAFLGDAIKNISATTQTLIYAYFFPTKVTDEDYNNGGGRAK